MVPNFFLLYDNWLIFLTGHRDPGFSSRIQRFCPRHSAWTWIFRPYFHTASFRQKHRTGHHAIAVRGHGRARARAALRWGLRPRMVAGRPFSQKMGRRWLWLLVEQGSWWVTTHPLRSRTNQDLIIACLSRAKCLLYNPIYIYIQCFSKVGSQKTPSLEKHGIY